MDRVLDGQVRSQGESRDQDRGSTTSTIRGIQAAWDLAPSYCFSTCPYWEAYVYAFLCLFLFFFFSFSFLFCVVTLVVRQTRACLLSALYTISHTISDTTVLSYYHTTTNSHYPQIYTDSMIHVHIHTTTCPHQRPTTPSHMHTCTPTPANPQGVFPTTGSRPSKDRDWTKAQSNPVSGGGEEASERSR
jgi:hypothetical protein